MYMHILLYVAAIYNSGDKKTIDKHKKIVLPKVTLTKSAKKRKSKRQVQPCCTIL